MLEAALQGKDSLLFSYGGGGSGKTHSMYGPNGGLDIMRLDGIVPCIITELFKRTMALEKGGDEKFALSATLVEAQGNHLVDLFADEERAQDSFMEAEPAYVKFQARPTPTMVGARSERVYSSRSLAQRVERAMLRMQRLQQAAESKGELPTTPPHLSGLEGSPRSRARRSTSRAPSSRCKWRWTRWCRRPCRPSRRRSNSRQRLRRRRRSMSRRHRARDRHRHRRQSAEPLTRCSPRT